VDTSGAAIRELLDRAGAVVHRSQIIPDDRDQISATLRSWADTGDLDLSVTTGGTGLSPRDVTPEATLAVLDYQVPGMGEAMRAEGLRHTPMAMLSRGVCGVRGRTLIINLPGSEKAVRENLGVVLPVLAHAVETLRGAVGDHGRES
jgi:molybdenum cofactor synthesis domain-containing protein